MRHLVICDYGSFIGLKKHHILIKQKDKVISYPLNRLRTLSIAKSGISISTDLIESLSTRGIKTFFLDFRGVAHSAILGQSQHGVVSVRIAQMTFCKNNTLPLAKKIISAKIKNQRAVLNYLDKYHKNSFLKEAIKELLKNSEQASQAKNITILLGFEGASANSYFQALRQSKLFSSSFKKREGRGSQEINNSMLNLGYSVLSSYLLNAIINAGLEPYLGLLHVKRPGKMALVLDLMEEYRAWVVDRNVIKLRSQSEGKSFLDSSLKKTLITEIQKTCSKKYLYYKKKLKLEYVMQRQVYRLCGHFYGEKIYRPYLFKW
ncbi:MAG: CRISPR-associated endonuclease Cas1 [Bdellovibrionales bacterium]|nr:CRISPR-associated endonuclease Cas1 [Bdellovibrionales bacterium]